MEAFTISPLCHYLNYLATSLIHTSLSLEWPPSLQISHLLSYVLDTLKNNEQQHALGLNPTSVFSLFSLLSHNCLFYFYTDWTFSPSLCDNNEYCDLWGASTGKVRGLIS